VVVQELEEHQERVVVQEQVVLQEQVVVQEQEEHREQVELQVKMVHLEVVGPVLLTGLLNLVTKKINHYQVLMLKWWLPQIRWIMLMV
jgi:hypothetical protein